MYDNTFIDTLSSRKEDTLTLFYSPFEPLAISLRNAKQPSDGLNGCIANRLIEGIHPASELIYFLRIYVSISWLAEFFRGRMPKMAKTA
jgi:hypothetical protein